MKQEDMKMKKTLIRGISLFVCVTMMFIALTPLTTDYVSAIEPTSTDNTESEETIANGDNKSAEDTSVNIKADNDLLISQIKGVEDGKAYNKPVTITFPTELKAKIVDDIGIITDFSSGDTIAENGEYEAVFYIDENGIETELTRISFEYDDIAPMVSGVEDKKIYTAKALVITLDEGTVTIDNKAYEPGTEYTKNGTHKLVATDNAGNVTEITFKKFTAKLVTKPTKTYTYKRMIKEINKLTKQYPGLISKSYIGKTVAKKKIPLVKVGNGKKKIFILGSEHAREHVSTNLIMYSIDTYAKSYAKGTKIQGTDTRKVLDKVTFYFVPMLNIDGVAIATGHASAKQKRIAKKNVGTLHYNIYRTMWKSNTRGVDINRNYPFRWKKGDTTGRKSFMGYKGKKAASEPETKAVIKLCKKNKFAFMYTMHTRGKVIYWRDAYTKTIPGASKLSKKVSAITGYKRMKTSSKSMGTAESAKWFRKKYNRPAFTIELTSVNQGYHSAPKKFFSAVWKRNKGLFIRTALTI